MGAENGGRKVSLNTMVYKSEAVDLTDVNLTPKEAFLFSRVEGPTEAGQLARIAGLPDEEALPMIEALVGKGVLSLNGQPVGPITGLDLRELEEEVDLDRETKMRILRTYSALSRVNHYQLLGLERRADTKKIKKAYFESSRLYHPDTYFRKNLGSYKTKIETIFKCVSQAYEELSNPQRREAYDKTLPYEPTEEEIEEKERERQREEADKRMREERKERLLRMNPLTQRRAQARQHVEEAQRFQKEGNDVRAANCARLALALDRDNKEAKIILDATEPKAARVRAERDYKRAMGEESLGRLEEALEWYRLSLEAFPDDSRVLLKTATLMLELNRDLLDAVQHCRRALQLEPDNFKIRLVLAKIYNQQQMHKNAFRELSLYLEANPLDEAALALQRELAKKVR